MLNAQTDGTTQLKCDCPSCHIDVLAIDDDAALEKASLAGWSLKRDKQLCRDCASGSCPAQALAAAKAQRAATVPGVVMVVDAAGKPIMIGGARLQLDANGIPMPPGKPGNPSPGAQRAGASSQPNFSTEPLVQDDEDDGEFEAEQDATLDVTTDEGERRHAARVAAHAKREMEKIESEDAAGARAQPRESNAAKGEAAHKRGEQFDRAMKERGASIPGVTQTALEAQRIVSIPPAPVLDADRKKMDEVNAIFEDIDQLVGKNGWDPDAR